jgi:hypothetical protein
MRLNPIVAAFLFVTVCSNAFAQEGVYKNDFQSAEVGKLPQEMMVIDGGFTIGEEGGNRFIELPGAPLETFGLLFGSTEKENRRVAARIFGTSKGRRAPTFSVGLGGVGGYKLQVSPAKKLLELYKADAVKSSVPFDWQTGKWTYLALTLKKIKETEWTLEGRAWTEGSAEPTAPTLKFTETEQPVAGRAFIGGSPYATTPIRFDDLFSGPAK